MQSIGTLLDWTLVVAVNDEAVLRGTLLASPDIDSHCQVIPKYGFSSAGAAYNSALAETTSDIVVFAHQDVYLPKGWFAALSRSLRALAITDPNWGVLGVFGVSRGNASDMRGHCYSTGLKRVLGDPFDAPIEAGVLDELLLVVRRGSGLKFDNGLPSFHLYATDICLQARANGMKCYIVSAFCVHNSNGVKYFTLDYWRSYIYMRRKWWGILPVKTCCSTISKSFLPMMAQVVSDIRQWLRGNRVVGTRCTDVSGLYRTVISPEEQVWTATSPMEKHACR